MKTFWKTKTQPKRGQFYGIEMFVPKKINKIQIIVGHNNQINMKLFVSSNTSQYIELVENVDYLIDIQNNKYTYSILSNLKFTKFIFKSVNEESNLNPNLYFIYEIIIL
jgi:predicted nucleic-acid-binding Zn-ribbon protein